MSQELTNELESQRKKSVINLIYRVFLADNQINLLQINKRAQGFFGFNS